jgi:hypothetical protein
MIAHIVIHSAPDAFLYSRLARGETGAANNTPAKRCIVRKDQEFLIGFSLAELCHGFIFKSAAEKSCERKRHLSRGNL